MRISHFSDAKSAGEFDFILGNCDVYIFDILEKSYLILVIKYTKFHKDIKMSVWKQYFIVGIIICWAVRP